jgi:hypothetical protein
MKQVEVKLTLTTVATYTRSLPQPGVCVVCPLTGEIVFEKRRGRRPMARSKSWPTGAVWNCTNCNLECNVAYS